MRILFFGTSSFALPALQAQVEAGHDVVSVVTQPDRPAGRGGKLTPPPVKDLAVLLGLPVLQPESCRTAEFLAMARELTPDLSVVTAYGQFLPDALLQVPPKGSVNLHGSLLPRHRGAAPIQRAIMAGDAVSGVCLMWMVREMDAGDIIACAETPITSEDNGGLLTERLAGIAARLLIEWLPALEAGTAPHSPQDSALVTFAPAIRKEDREIDWRLPAEVVWRQIRALAPNPAATTTFRGMPLKILAAKIPEKSPAGIEGVSGEVVELSSSDGPLVATGDGVLYLLSLHPAGKRPMSGADFIRGYRVVPGEHFGI